MVSSRIEGKVVTITADGNLVTNITSQQLENAPRDERVRVCCDEHETNGIFGPDHTEPDSTFLAMLNADGTLELAIIGLNASEMLGIRVGENVVVEW